MQKGNISNQMAPAILIEYELLIDEVKKRLWKRDVVFDDISLGSVYGLHKRGYNLFVFSLRTSQKEMEKQLDRWPIQEFFFVESPKALVQLLKSAGMADIAKTYATEEVYISVGSRVTLFESWEKVSREV